MNTSSFSYRHLHYFWVVANEGGVARAAERLGVAVQTVSAQVRELERDLGYTLLKPAGRGLALTEAGLAAMRHADQIFQLGEQLPSVVRAAVSAPVVRLTVGISDGLPKLVVRRLLQPVMLEPKLHLICSEDSFDDLLAAVALHRLDVVLADRPAPPGPSLKLYSHPLGSSAMGWYGSEALVAQAQPDFPNSLATVPVLLPCGQSAMRVRLDQWFTQRGVRPNIVGEFEDSALLKTFGASGMGVFPAALWVHDDLLNGYGVRALGSCDGVTEHFFAIGTEKKIQHPLVQRLQPEQAKSAPSKSGTSPPLPK